MRALLLLRSWIMIKEDPGTPSSIYLFPFFSFFLWSGGLPSFFPYQDDRSRGHRPIIATTAEATMSRADKNAPFHAARLHHNNVSLARRRRRKRRRHGYATTAEQIDLLRRKGILYTREFAYITLYPLRSMEITFTAPPPPSCIPGNA